MSTTRLQRIALVLALAPVATACTVENGTASAYEPRFERVRCPSEAQEVLLQHSCGYLVVPENRSEPAGPTVRIFVLTVHPPGSDAATDPLLNMGGDISEVIEYPGLAPAAQRVNRVVYLMDKRGSGHSEPNIDCPEVRRMDWRLRPVRSSDPTYVSGYLVAVERCRDRLVRSGVDLSAYNLAEMAADVEDLRRVLGIEQWNLLSVGTSSRIALEVMRRFPDHIRSVIMDSPSVPADGGFRRAADSTRQVLQEVQGACQAQPSCATPFPNILRALDEAVAGFQKHPLMLRAAAGGRPPIEVALDGALFVRLVRGYAAQGNPSSPGWERLAALVYDGAAGRFDLSQDLGPQYLLCVGYSQFCGWGIWNVGLFFSEVCHDELPSTAPTVSRAGWLDEGFDPHLYVEICRVWGAGRAAPIDPVVSSDVPTLVLVGRFDPYITQSGLARALAGLTHDFLVTGRTLSRNLLGYDCPLEIRNAWIDQPESPPDTTCLDDLSSPPLIAPVPRPRMSGPSDIPDGRYRVGITVEDSTGSGLGASRFRFAPMVLTLTLQDGRFTLHQSGPAAGADQVGWYRSGEDSVTFTMEEPFITAGMTWDVPWRTDGRSLIFGDVQMSSRLDAQLGYGAYLGPLNLWMETHPWRRL